MDVAPIRIAVELDAELAYRLDELAARIGISRSELVRRGASLIVRAAAQASEGVEATEAYRRFPEDGDDLERFVRAAVGYAED